MTCTSNSLHQGRKYFITFFNCVFLQVRWHLGSPERGWHDEEIRGCLRGGFHALPTYVGHGSLGQEVLRLNVPTIQHTPTPNCIQEVFLRKKIIIATKGSSRGPPIYMTHTNTHTHKYVIFFLEHKYRARLSLVYPLTTLMRPLYGAARYIFVCKLIDEVFIHQ